MRGHHFRRCLLRFPFSPGRSTLDSPGKRKRASSFIGRREFLCLPERRRIDSISVRTIFRKRKERLAEPFEDLYRAHFRFVWRALGSMGVRKVDLMDFTQNVFIIVHPQLASFEGRSELSTWLVPTLPHS